MEISGIILSHQEHWMNLRQKKNRRDLPWVSKNHKINFQFLGIEYLEKKHGHAMHAVHLCIGRTCLNSYASARVSQMQHTFDWLMLPNILGGESLSPFWNSWRLNSFIFRTRLSRAREHHYFRPFYYWKIAKIYHHAESLIYWWGFFWSNTSCLVVLKAGKEICFCLWRNF